MFQHGKLSYCRSKTSCIIMQRVRKSGLILLWACLAIQGKRNVLGAEAATLDVRASYQLVGDWTAPDPKQPVSFMRDVAPGEFEKILKSSAPGEKNLILVKDHDGGQILGQLAVSVTQTNRQFWRVRYVEKTKELTCKPDDFVEFSYRAKDDSTLRKDAPVRSVNLAGSFNDWSATATPMADMGDGTYVADVKLEEGVHHYKFVVNGNIWMQDPNSDPSLRVDDEPASWLRHDAAQGSSGARMKARYP